jgi:uncharacterized protein (DUF697 family)
MPARARTGGASDPTTGPEAAADADLLPAVVRRLTADDSGGEPRRRLLLRLSRLLASSARQAGAAAVATGRWLTDVVVDVSPHIAVRDLDTLRRHHDGLSGDQLADALIESAARKTAGIGAAVGLLATAEWAMPATLASTPVQLAVETVAVVAVELKLVAELHEVYGHAPRGSSRSRATSYLFAWSRRRGIDPMRGGGLMGEIVSAAAKRQLRGRLLRRTGAGSMTVLPFFAGAVAGATLNAKATRRLGELVAADLVRRGRR